MRKTRILFLFYGLLLLAITGCTDDFSSDAWHPALQDGTSFDSVFNGNSQTCILTFDLLQEEEPILAEGDFFTLEKADGKWQLYLEENSENSSRIGKIAIRQANGTLKTFSFLQQGRSTVELQLNKRNYGLGYSYAGFTGEKCDPNSVMSQVINLAEVRKAQEENPDLLISTDFNKSVYSLHLNKAYSFSEFVHNTYAKGGVNVNILLFKADVEKAKSLLEYQRNDYVFICSEQRVEKAKLELFSNELKRAIKERPEILTHSFRKAVKKMEEDPQNLVRIDSFLVRFGSHVVTSSTMGGSLKLYNSLSRKSFTDIAKEEDFSSVQILLFFNQRKESSEAQQYETVMNNSSLSLEVKGGKLSFLNEALFNPSFKNARITEEALNDWMESVQFRAEEQFAYNPDLNNAEMVDMELTPIWDFITNDTVRQAVKARALGSVCTLAEIFGTSTFPNVKITIDEFDNLAIPNYILGNRMNNANPYGAYAIHEGKIVAAIFREALPIDRNEYGWWRRPTLVVYPVRNNEIDLTAGYCIPLESGERKYNSYHIKWIYDTFEMSPSESGTYDNTHPINEADYYLTNGRLSASPVEGVDYEDVQYISAIAFPGSIDVNGNLTGKPYYGIRKFLGHFYLDTAERFDNLPGWSYCTDYPEDVKKYIQMFEGYDCSYLGAKIEPFGLHSFSNRMIMNDDAKINWNPQEIKPL